MTRLLAFGRPFASFASLALIASAVACFPSGGPERPIGRRATAFVEVTNSSWFDVVVYSLGSGPRWRLGMVTSMSTETFRIPEPDLLAGSGLRLMADPIGSPDVFTSDRILAMPGQRVELMVAPRLSQSYFAVRQ
jgi:hypothetical protein